MANTTLGQTAQIISDVFYQSYITDESFFKDVHFRYIIAGYYSSLLIADYENSKKENMAETGYIYPSFSADLIRSTDPLDVKQDGDFSYIETEEVIDFPFDNYGYGVQSIGCERNTVNSNFYRTNLKTKNKFNVIPSDGLIWWWVEGKRIYMYSGAKIPKKIVANIIPSMNWEDEKFIIPSATQAQIINGVTDFFKQKTANTAVDVSNNSNPNAVLQSEIDSVFRNLKTKQQ